MRLGLSWTVLVLVGALLPLGCAGEAEQIARLDSPAPQERFEAVVWLSKRGSQLSLPALIARLEDDDPSVRWAAVHALRDRTGENLGYRPEDPEPRRLEAAERWWAWWKKGQVQEPEDEGAVDHGLGARGPAGGREAAEQQEEGALGEGRPP